ncbi:hypothetical protein [Hoeflea sp.]|uniref:hypothetical protein n=1 Tax=Hoeflea sp. TaxID=1940281 RepID=UPI001991DBF9|nr:hypothetical protein [Hoeflea sp.]MBC7284491.1 hypothetical protein [Hoeflea sp.]
MPLPNRFSTTVDVLTYPLRRVLAIMPRDHRTPTRLNGVEQRGTYYWSAGEGNSDCFVGGANIGGRARGLDVLFFGRPDITTVSIRKSNGGLHQNHYIRHPVENTLSRALAAKPAGISISSATNGGEGYPLGAESFWRIRYNFDSLLEGTALLAGEQRQYSLEHLIWQSGERIELDDYQLFGFSGSYSKTTLHINDADSLPGVAGHSALDTMSGSAPVIGHSPTPGELLERVFYMSDNVPKADPASYKPFSFFRAAVRPIADAVGDDTIGLPESQATGGSSTGVAVGSDDASLPRPAISLIWPPPSGRIKSASPARPPTRSPIPLARLMLGPSEPPMHRSIRPSRCTTQSWRWQPPLQGAMASMWP